MGGQVVAIVTTESLEGGVRPTHCLTCGVALREPPAHGQDKCQQCSAPVYRVKAGPVCAKCGHRDGLFVLNANHQPVHEGVCWAEPPVPDPPALIAHDPFDWKAGEHPRAKSFLNAFGVGRNAEASEMAMHPGARAHLREHGVEFKTVRQFKNPVGTPAVFLEGTRGPEQTRPRSYDKDEVEAGALIGDKRVKTEDLMDRVAPGDPVPGDPYQKPLQARKKKSDGG